jgi:lysophospholipase L1-like esterase
MRFPRNLALLLAALGIALGAAELGLRVAGFAFEPTLESVEFGWPNIEVREARYASDPDLFWVPKDYAERLGRLAGTRADLVFLGDSVTEWGRWPRDLLQRLQRDRAEGAWSAATLGTAGWSSYQGLQQLRRDVAPLRPRVVVLWFGWNDHWRGMGVDDAGVHAISRPQRAWLRRLRLEQLWLKARLAWRTRDGVAAERVAPDDFQRNLAEMIRLTRSFGGVPVLVTAPSNHRVGREPAHLAPRWIEDLSQLVPVHQRYVAIVREVAQRDGAVLCDLAARFEALPDDERERAFAGDGIHLTRAGDQRAAAWLAECLEASPALAALQQPPRS